MNKHINLIVGRYFVWASDPSKPTLCKVVSCNVTQVGFKIVGTSIRLECPPSGFADFEDLSRKNLSLCKGRKASKLIKNFPQAKLEALRRVEVPLS